jgi:hypothetical protein
MNVSKDKIPKTMSYPLKTSVLEAAFVAAGIKIDTSLSYVTSKRFFDCEFWPPNQNVPHERLYISICAIRNERAREARDFVEKEVIPALIAWVRSLQDLPANSPVSSPTATLLPRASANDTRERRRGVLESLA